MGDFVDAEQVRSEPKKDDIAVNPENVLQKMYDAREQQIVDLNKINVALRTRIQLLEDTIKKERAEREKIPVPTTVIRQLIDITDENEKLKDRIKELQHVVKEYSKHVPLHKIINNKNNLEEKTYRRGSGLK
jgi:hypothetical protein